MAGPAFLVWTLFSLSVCLSVYLSIYLSIYLSNLCIYVSIQTFILRNWLMQLWGMAGPKSAGQTGQLRNRRVDVAA